MLSIVPFVNNPTPEQCRCKIERNCSLKVDTTNRSVSLVSKRPIYADHEIYVSYGSGFRMKHLPINPDSKYRINKGKSTEIVTGTELLARRK